MTEAAQFLRRRQLLAGSAGAIAAAGLAGFAREAAAQAAPAPAAPAGPRPLPPYAAWKDANAVIVHSAQTIETRRSAYGTSVVTPADQLYVRNNLPPPDAAIVANRDAWSVSVEGVRNPRVLTVADLKSIGIETVATGGEKLPDGVDPLSIMVERSVSITAMTDALLAWEMNGAPLSLTHGGPLRLVVPGYNGVNNVKYVKRVAFTSAESQAKIQTTGYRMTALGATSTTSDPSIQELNVKSFVTSPAGDRSVRAGTVYVTGVAFSGGSPIRRVEVSSDGGKTWLEAAFVGPDLGRFAWRQFAIPLSMTPGNYVLASRAFDAAGQTQPERGVDNLHGYSHNSWADPAVRVAVV